MAEVALREEADGAVVNAMFEDAEENDEKDDEPVADWLNSTLSRTQFLCGFESEISLGIITMPIGATNK
jgi:hypothetical protein